MPNRGESQPSLESLNVAYGALFCRRKLTVGAVRGLYAGHYAQGLGGLIASFAYQPFQSTQIERLFNPGLFCERFTHRGAKAGNDDQRYCGGM
jgi:hypothetical protein